MKKNEIWRSYGTDYKDLTKRLLRQAGLAELLPSQDARIAIKPNLVTPSPAEFGGTTHTEVVAGIIEFLQERGFYDIIIAEGSWVGDRTEEAFEYCGYRNLARSYHVTLLDTQKEKGFTVDCGVLVLPVFEKSLYLWENSNFSYKCKRKTANTSSAS
jgi:uncharacterized protein (DUF362 family)